MNSLPLPDHDRHIGHFGERPARRGPRLAVDPAARGPAIVAAHATHARVSNAFSQFPVLRIVSSALPGSNARRSV